MNQATPRCLHQLSFYSLVAFAALALGCQPAATRQGVAPDLGPALQALVDGAVEDNEAVHGAALHVDTPALDLVWEGAAGEADPAAGVSMTPATPFQIASNTKTFISASTLRLWEDGRLGLDDPIAGHIREDSVEILRSDGYDLEELTIRHLLTHTGGLYDYAMSERYSERIIDDPTHRWTRTEQLEAAVEWGDPLAPPGVVYSYCDTGYILLGEILELTTGRSMPDAVRELVGYEGLGLGSTWFETLEPRPSGVLDPAHPFWGEEDGTAFDLSIDLYGGGGLLSTVGDLAHFFRALFKGGIYTDPGTADTMLTTVEIASPEEGGEEFRLPHGAYRMGVWVVEVEGYTSYRHTGFWGTSATYLPELDLIITATVNQNQARPVLEELVRSAVRVVADAVEAASSAEEG